MNRSLLGHFQNEIGTDTAVMQEVNIIKISCIGNCWFQNGYYGIHYMRSLVILKLSFQCECLAGIKYEPGFTKRDHHQVLTGLATTSEYVSAISHIVRKLIYEVFKTFCQEIWHAQACWVYCRFTRMSWYLGQTKNEQEWWEFRLAVCSRTVSTCVSRHHSGTASKPRMHRESENTNQV